MYPKQSIHRRIKHQQHYLIMKLAHFLPLLALSYETTHADVDHGEGGSLRFLAQEDFSLSSDLSLSVAGILPVGSGKSSIVSNVGSSKAEKSASTSFSKAGKKMKSTYEIWAADQSSTVRDQTALGLRGGFFSGYGRMMRSRRRC